MYNEFRVTVQQHEMANGGKSYSLGVNGAACGITLYRDDRKSRPEEILIDLLKANIDAKN